MDVEEVEYPADPMDSETRSGPAQDFPRSSGNAEKLCFVCGALRSGTTLLRLMLDHHRQISNAGEADFLFDYWKSGANESVAIDIASMREDRIFQSYELDLPPEKAGPILIEDLVRQMRQPGKILTLNIHRHFERIPLVFPGATYIHLMRDPRAVAVSSIGMGWAGNAYYGVDHWIDSERSFEQLRTSIPSDRIMEIRYENLVQEAPAILTKLCNFLGVEYDADMLRYSERSTYEAPNTNSLSHWKTHLSKRETAFVEAKLGAMLTDRGYQQSTEIRSEPARLAKIWLNVTHRYGRVRFDIRRYGFILMLFERIARRLRLTSWHKKLIKKINVIAIANLK